MKIQYSVQIFIFFCTSLVFALPVANLKSGRMNTQESGCARNPQQSFRDLIQKVSVIDADDREILSRNWEKIGFNSDEVEQAMRCTGNIYCPGAISKTGGLGANQSAGAICPKGARSSNGKCAADRLGTVAHMFVNDESNKFIPKEKHNKFISQLNKCEFQTYRGHTSKLVVEDLRSIGIGNSPYNPHKNTRADKVVVRLKTPIPGCDPYDLDEQPASPPMGSEIIALTYKHADQTNSVADGSEPLAFVCNITRMFRPRADGAAGAFYSDCDINGGGSGGFALVRNSDNRLAVTGLFTSSGSAEQNGDSYDESEKVKNYTVSTSTNADFVQLALHPGTRPEPQLTQGEVPKLRPTSN